MLAAVYQCSVCDVMYGPCSQEEHTADSQVGEQHEEPDSWREGIEEGEVTRLPTLVQRERRGGGERRREMEQQRQMETDRQKGTVCYKTRCHVSAVRECPLCTTGGQCPSLYSDCKSAVR